METRTDFSEAGTVAAPNVKPKVIEKEYDGKSIKPNRSKEELCNLSGVGSHLEFK